MAFLAAAARHRRAGLIGRAVGTRQQRMYRRALAKVVTAKAGLRSGLGIAGVGRLRVQACCWQQCQAQAQDT
ncbi:hypothetical protein [Kineobactrum salinum]|uniref:Uncharacterized protein n=1 Tax=Kineobactrum salinum TaxID=2708301 RepID=A0A6C0U2I7_9GAMM|nr:hypothetical protein [Kineobactrum salinum]QIB66372.1 hypothetical protein G3T16_14185 [Kineobactrum salinum]